MEYSDITLPNRSSHPPNAAAEIIIFLNCKLSGCYYGMLLCKNITIT